MRLQNLLNQVKIFNLQEKRKGIEKETEVKSKGIEHELKEVFYTISKEKRACSFSL